MQVIIISNDNDGKVIIRTRTDSQKMILFRSEYI